ncbi:hypothetical protein QBC46DRAFT_424937 [Diplogelasinospora grovesii]|uniref:LIM zinc-binding domain-containing protein n=1 Tax=Diplogelasinospora grovesii TaxID=303347 RepID=A0AAN6NHN3_9PEZI|nr:hypothetical protein QBC46DRAFT_424937 [Diplogelasinospora grovesii]
MAGMPRESSFMPTVKCSTCGLQVEISLMGEHLCAGAPAAEATPPMPAPSLFDRFNPFGYATADKQQPRVPPTLDTSAANRAYMGQGELTPVSFSSGSQSVSPKTPNSRPGAGRTDEDFTPQIANDSPPPQQSRRPGGYGGFGDTDREGGDSMASDLKKQAPNLLQRMNSIAPGPFEAGRRPSATGRNAFPGRGSTDSSMNDTSNDRPGTSASNAGSSLGSMKSLRAPRKDGYGGFGPPQKGDEDSAPNRFGMPNRSDTFPRPSETTEPPLRTPSAPGPRPDRFRRPSNTSQDMDNRIPMTPMTSERARRPSRGPDTSRPPPPRTSVIRPRTAGRDGSAPAVPAINLAEEFGIGNPYHAPSESTSSSASGVSGTSGSSSQFDRRPSAASSRTSPSRSISSRSGRNPSDTSSFDNLMSDLQSSMEEMKPKPSPVSPLQPPSRGKSMRSPLANRPPPPDRGYDPRIDPAIQNPRPGRARSPLASPISPVDNTSNRDDPAVQRPGRSLSPGFVPAAAPPSPRLPNSTNSSNSSERSRTRSRSRPPQERPRSRSRARDPAVPSSRGDCKACGLPIKGKSISSADGRLTGRYHKECFVCSTCKEPFSSSTFYVFDDRPYCGLHYHKLNGSLCGSCGKGIEGQYLEDESTNKHHVGCFRCGDCGMVLRDGYFDVDGKAYCEKDAWRRVQQPMPQPMQQPPRMGMGMGRGGGPPRKGSAGPTLGLPGGPRMGGALGLPNGSRFGPRPPRMEKRMTRLGMM